MSTWSKITKNAASFVNQIKRVLSYLLSEDNTRLLLEDSGKIILDRGNEWSDSAKNVATYTNLTKN